jgi:hypothetical protein
MNAPRHTTRACCAVFVAFIFPTVNFASAGLFTNWTHSGGDDAAIQDWLFAGIAFDQVGPQGNAHYFGSYDTPWSAETIDLRIAIAIRTPAPLVLPPPLGIRFQTWQPYIDRWPVSLSLSLYNFTTRQFDVTAAIGYTGGTLANSADFPMALSLAYPATADYVRDSSIRVSYDLMFRDDNPSLTYARAHTLAFLPDNLTTGVPPVPEPSTYAMALAGLACGGLFLRRRRAINLLTVFAFLTVASLTANQTFAGAITVSPDGVITDGTSQLVAVSGTAPRQHRCDQWFV